MIRDREAEDFDAVLHRWQMRLPTRMAQVVGWLRRPQARYARVPAAVLIIMGGFVGFLPILGFWMIPLGLLLIALDIPALRPPMTRLMAWAERKWVKPTPGK